MDGGDRNPTRRLHGDGHGVSDDGGGRSAALKLNGEGGDASDDGGDRCSNPHLNGAGRSAPHVGGGGAAPLPTSTGTADTCRSMRGPGSLPPTTNGAGDTMGGGGETTGWRNLVTEMLLTDLTVFSGWNDLAGEAPSADLAVLLCDLFGGINDADRAFAAEYAAWTAQGDRAAQGRREAQVARVATEIWAAQQARAALVADLAAVEADWEMRDAQRAETGQATGHAAALLMESLALRENHEAAFAVLRRRGYVMPHYTMDFPVGQTLAEVHQAVVASLHELSLQQFPRGLARAVTRRIAFSLAAATANVRAVEVAALLVQGEITAVCAAAKAA